MAYLVSKSYDAYDGFSYIYYPSTFVGYIRAD